MGRAVRTSALVALVLAFCTGVCAGKAAPRGDGLLREKNTELDSIRTALQKGRQKLDSLKKREGSSLSQLNQIEKNVQLAGEYVRELSGKIETGAARLTRLRDSLAAAEKQLASRQAIMARRLRSMYIWGLGRPSPADDMRLLFTSESVVDALRRIRIFRGLRAYDGMLIAHIDSSKSIVAGRATAVQAEMDRLASLRLTKEKEQHLLISERATQQQLLGAIRSEKQSYTALVKQLEESQRKLTGIIEELLKKRERPKKPAPGAPGQPAFVKKKGSFPWPLRGSVVTGFGRIVHPVYRTTIVSNGIDIRPGADRTARSIAAGTVVYIGWMRGLGQFVMVEHADGFLSIYARLANVAVARGQKVTGAAPVGSVGPGEDLHFEIRKAAEPLDPREWLE